MKKIFSILCMCCAMIVLSCTSKESTAESVHEDEDQSGVSDNTYDGVCLWKEVSLRETPSEKGKYLTTVYRGEKLVFTGDTATENVNDKTRQYNRVTLSDGAQGWIRADFMANDAIPATLLTTSNLFKRPDENTVTLKEFGLLDFVVITSQSGADWCEVKGKPLGQEWFSTGWVKCADLSRDAEHVRYSLLYAKANEIEDSVKREAEIDKLSTIEGFEDSPFYTSVSIRNSFSVHEDEEYDSLE